MSDKKYPSNLYLESVTTSVDFASHVSVEAVIVMAKELLALRKATSETYGWIAEYPSPPIGSGGMSYEFHDNQMEALMAANEYEGFAIEVSRKP